MEKTKSLKEKFWDMSTNKRMASFIAIGALTMGAASAFPPGAARGICAGACIALTIAMLDFKKEGEKLFSHNHIVSLGSWAAGAALARALVLVASSDPQAVNTNEIEILNEPSENISVIDHQGLGQQKVNLEFLSPKA